jgi:hypothetical protein
LAFVLVAGPQIIGVLIIAERVPIGAAGVSRATGLSAI